LGLTLFFILCTPHFSLVSTHDYVTLTYAFDRVGSPPTLWNHFAYPWQFFYEQFEALLPALILFAFLCLGKGSLSRGKLSLNRYDQVFLILMGLGPFFVTLLLSLLQGLKLRAGWGQPLFSLGGILLFAYLQPKITAQRFYSFIALFTVLMLGAWTGYSLAFIRGKEPSSANFPGQDLALTLTQEWHKSYHQPLAYVAGSRWLAGNLAFYSADHPHVYISWNKKLSPWIQERDLQKKGAIFIWAKDEILPLDLSLRFPRLSKVIIMQLPWLRNKALAPTEIKVAYLPPAAIA